MTPRSRQSSEAREPATLTAQWVDGDEPANAVHVGWMGGDPRDPTWEEYVAGFTEEGRAIVEAVRAAHEREGLDLYGEDMNNGYFLLSDGRVFSLSWRAWGDFRQAMEGKREGYMRYYMR